MSIFLASETKQLPPTFLGASCEPRGVQPQKSALLRANRKDFLAFYLNFYAERRTQVRALHDASTSPHAAREIAQFEWVENRSAAGVSNHGMFGGTEAVIVFEFVQIRNIFELAIPVGRFLGEGPIAARLGGRAERQAHEEGRNVFAAEAVANIKLF